MAFESETIRPQAFVVPIIGSADRYTMIPEVGTLQYDSDLKKLVICVSAVVGSAAWEAVTSVAE